MPTGDIVEICPACYLGAFYSCTDPQDVTEEGFIPCGQYEDSLPSPLSASNAHELAIVDEPFRALAPSMTIVNPETPYDPDIIARSPTSGRRLKPDAMLRNPARVGRQRANRVKPIKPGDICEWSELKYAGGGLVSIIGCYKNPAQTVHHGPDKDWLNNDESNLHKICNACHALYHGRNDPFYITERPAPGNPFLFQDTYVEMFGGLKPHDTTTKATLQEIFDQIADVKKQELYYEEAEERSQDSEVEAGVSTDEEV